MRFPFLLAISLCCPQLATAFPAQGQTYEVTLVDELRTETKTMTVSTGAPPRILDMAGGFLEIAPARSSSGPSALSFYLNVQGKPVMVHNARIEGSAKKPVQVAYLVCGAAVTYLSPRPARLPKCDTAAVAARQP